MKIKLTFTEPLLGTLAGEKEIAKEYIASKVAGGVPKSDEVEAIESLDESLEKGSTVFNADEQGGFLWDYQIKGFFKDAMLAIATAGDYTQDALKKAGLTKYMYKRTIDHHLFINPRKIHLNLSGPTYFIERPLRADTMRGERIALARSEAAPAGTTCEIEIKTLNKKLIPFIKECLDYGELRGIGQWRNSGMGRFTFEELQ